MPKAAPTIVRDLISWPDLDVAQASLGDLYAQHPYAGVLRLEGDEGWMHVFSTIPRAELLDDGWVAREDDATE